MTTTKQIRDIGVSEFQNHATRYVFGPDTIAIRNNGHLIGVYIPIKQGDEMSRQTAALVDSVASEILELNGITEAELIALSERYTRSERDVAARREALERFWRNMDRIRQEIGMTEDEFADMLDVSKPFSERSLLLMPASWSLS